MTILNCIICNNEFSVPDKRKNTAKYCGEKCKGIGRQFALVIGSKYGMLTIIKEIESVESAWGRKRMVLCKCDCGNTIETLLSSVRHGNTTSCGCFKLKVNRECRNRVTHGLSGHTLYAIWLAMRNRCYNKKDKGFKIYGAKGVRVCKEWRHDFKCFYEWAIANGWKTSLQIDKDKLAPTKPGKLYSPEFCCFLTHKENTRCTSTTLLNLENAEIIRKLYETGNYTYKELAVTYSVKPSTIGAVILKRNWV